MDIGPAPMRRILESLDYTYYDESDLTPMIFLLAAAQDHRYAIGNAKVKEVTRSTALVVFNQLNPMIAKALQAAGVNWDAYCHQLALDDPIAPREVEDVDLHEDFIQALTLFRESHPDRQMATPGNLALAIIAMAVRYETTGLITGRLREAGADLNLLLQMLLEALDAEPSGEADQDDAGTGKAPDDRGARPTLWLLHYKEEDRPATFFRQADAAGGIEWRSTKIIDTIKPEDPVIYWRDINRKTKDRGGLVGTGRFVGGISRSEQSFDKKKQKEITWHYYPTRFVELFPDNLLARDELLDKTDLNLNWGLGSILKVPPDMAARVDAYLMDQGRRGLFLKLASDAAPQIDFIGDAPKTEVDFLKRGDLAFVLAARLNRVWDETNLETEGTQNTHQKSPYADQTNPIFNPQWWARLFRRPKRSAFENSFVVHIDAPWGGGKTTFANYVIRILNPYRVAGKPPDWLAGLPLDRTRFWPPEFRRPWHIVSFNAWQHQHVDPPWWCFYQAIRRQCFHSVRTETFAAQTVPSSDKTQPEARSDAQIPPKPSVRYDFPSRLGRHLKWLRLWVRELIWRIFNPKIKTLMVTFLLTLIAALILHEYELFKPLAFKNALSAGSKSGPELPALITTGLVILFSGATAIWSVFAALTESLLPGTPDAAKNYSLGSGDPLDRFRVHFDRTIRSLKRPILVVVDDIDRCEPRFVVELLRGIQTILRSPRVVFVLLGDRDWIEHAFANVHAAMKGIEVGPEHTFGGRFVEKAIQLSLVLPDITREGRTDYVRQLLGVSDAVSKEGTNALPENERKDVEQDLNEILSTNDPVSRDTKAATLRQAISANEALGSQIREAVVKQIDRQMALRSASDQRVQKATQHRLVPIAPVLPANPRQIKRIINGIALFQEIARIVQQIQPESAQWCKLSLWVVIMTEWPKTWATLSTYPGLVERIRVPAATPTSALPEAQLAQDWVEAIQRNTAIMRLLNFSSDEGFWAEARIDAKAIEQFRSFMPSAGGELLPRESDQSSV